MSLLFHWFHFTPHSKIPIYLPAVGTLASSIEEIPAHQTNPKPDPSESLPRGKKGKVVSKLCKFSFQVHHITQPMWRSGQKFVPPATSTVLS